MTHLQPSQQSATPKLSLRLLGGFSAVGADGQSPVLSYVKLRALLACLAIERGNELPRSWLAGLLWPELDEGIARQNLRRALSNLRTALNDEEGEDSFFRISRASISLNPAAPIDIDVADILEPPAACETLEADAGDQARCRDCLLRMETVVGRYRGELLPGFSLPDNPEFEQWLSSRRELLHRHALQLLDRLAACHMARGDPVRALPFGLRRLDLDPWDEAALRRLMSIYVAGGQASAALNQFHSFRRELEHELGILPDRETQRLAEEIGPAVIRQSSAEPDGLAPERRQVTVVCCQLQPPEEGESDGDDIVESLPRLRQRCDALLQELGAYTQPIQGGVLAYFGYPKADERAPLNAVSAALSVARAEGFAGVVLRIGVHTGLVLSDAESGEVDVAGNASGVAMAVPLLVAPGTVALTLPTYHLVSRAVDCESLGTWHLGGKPRALGLYRALALHDAGRRLHAGGQPSLPFVGREAELAELHGEWRGALAGERRAFLLRGEAGIGKSRLARSLVDQVGREGGQVIELSCQPESAQEALHPLRTFLARQIDTADAAGSCESPEACLAEFARLHFASERERLVALGRWLLDLGSDASSRASVAGDDGTRRRMLGLLLEFLDAHSVHQPLLVLIEDVHWADPSTRELLELFAGRRGASRILLLATARPEFEALPNWGQALLAPLHGVAVRAMVAALAAGQALPAGVVDRIVAFSDGVPLFVEETTRMMLRAGVMDEDSPSSPAIPHSLRDLLASRLDVLAEAKPVAQHAAILGRRFEVQDLACLLAMSSSDLNALLARMEAAGLIAREPHGYQFRHALIREAAYQSLLPSKRKQLHRRAAEMLRRHKPQLAAQQPGLVAHHYTEAGATEEALEYHRLAAGIALRYAAFREHVWHLRQALAQLERAERTDNRPPAVEIGLLVQLGWAVGEIEGLGSAAARDLYDRAFELCRHAEGGIDLFKTLLGMWRGSSSWSGYARSLELSEQLLTLAERAGDAHQQALACYALGNVHCALGNLDAAVSHLRRSIAVYRPDMPVAEYGDSAGVGAHAFLGWAQTLRGFSAAGLHEARNAVSLARQLDHPPALCLALIFAAETHRLRREPQAVVACAAEAASVAGACGIAAWAVFAEVFLGWGEALKGQATGFERARRALDQIMSSIMAGTAAPLHALVADAALHLGMHAQGLRAVAEALALMDRSHGRHLQADLLLLRAALFRGLGQNEEARSCTLEALDIATAQGARLFELRAATSLLRAPDEAQGLLAPLLARVRALLGAAGDGEDDLACQREARGLLATLAV